MRHEWIFDTLSDLKTYALANGLLALAAKADEALVVAREDVKRAEEAEAAADKDQARRPKSH